MSRVTFPDRNGRILYHKSMEENPTAVNNEQEKKPHPLTALAFLEVGLFEIVFVIVGVFLIFGTLNYFNILPARPQLLHQPPPQHLQNFNP